MSVVNNKWESLHFAAAADVQAGRMVISSFVWSGSTNATHTMTMKNSAGDIVCGPMVAGIIGQPIQVNFPEGKFVNGLEVDVLGSGVVDVYLR